MLKKLSDNKNNIKSSYLPASFSSQCLVVAKKSCSPRYNAYMHHYSASLQRLSSLLRTASRQCSRGSPLRDFPLLKSRSSRARCLPVQGNAPVRGSGDSPISSPSFLLLVNLRVSFRLSFTWFPLLLASLHPVIDSSDATPSRVRTRNFIFRDFLLFLFLVYRLFPSVRRTSFYLYVSFRLYLNSFSCFPFALLQVLIFVPSFFSRFSLAGV